MASEIQPTNTELIKQMDPRHLRLITGAVAMGLAHGALMDNTAANWYNDAQKVLAEQAQQERGQKPPKPPRRPNARIGKAILGHGY